MRSLARLRILQLEEAAGSLKDWSVEILATDLNERSLAHAKAAVYGDYSTRNLSPAFRQKYFVPQGGKFQLSVAFAPILALPASICRMTHE